MTPVPQCVFHQITEWLFSTLQSLGEILTSQARSSRYVLRIPVFHHLVERNVVQVIDELLIANRIGNQFCNPVCLLFIGQLFVGSDVFDRAFCCVQQASIYGHLQNRTIDRVHFLLDFLIHLQP